MIENKNKKVGFAQSGTDGSDIESDIFILTSLQVPNKFTVLRVRY